jgi:hypothetical protein
MRRDGTLYFLLPVLAFCATAVVGMGALSTSAVALVPHPAIYELQARTDETTVHLNWRNSQAVQDITIRVDGDTLHYGPIQGYGRAETIGIHKFCVTPSRLGYQGKTKCLRVDVSNAIGEAGAR